MAFKLADIFVDLTMRDNKFNAKTAEAKKEVKELDKSMKDSFANFAMYGAPIAALMTKVLVDFANAEETVSKFNAVFKGGAAESALFADRLANAVGRSKYEIMGMMASMQDTLVPMGMLRDDAANVSENITALAIDVASFQNKLDADVMRDFQSALVGNVETVRKYGIVINEARLNQELLEMGTGRTNRTASEQQKVMARLRLITKGSSDAIGDAAKTMGSLTNQYRAGKAAVYDLSVQFGALAEGDAKEVIGLFRDLARTIEWIVSLKKELNDMIGDWSEFTDLIAMNPLTMQFKAINQARGAVGLQSSAAQTPGATSETELLKRMEQNTRSTANNTKNSLKVSD